MLTKPGIYPDVAMVDYVLDPAPQPSLSTGVIHSIVTRSPAHAYCEHPRLGGKCDDSSSRSDLGSAAHAKLLGGADAVCIVYADDWRTKAAKEERDAARAVGQIPVLGKDAAALDALVKSARARLDEAGIDLYSARVEHTVIWQDDGIWCRSRPDAIFDRYVIDLKTTNNADPGAWVRSTLMNSGYHIQAAHCLRGLDVIGETPRDFVFLAAELEPPYACSLVGVGPALLDLAQRQCAAALETWKRCLSTGVWPGYRKDIHWADAPAYAEMAWELRAAEVA